MTIPMLGDIPEFKSRISNPKQAGISVSESQVKINDVYEIVKEETRLRSEDIPNTDAVNSNDCEFVLKQSGIYIKVAIKEDSQIEQLEKKDIPVAFEYSIKKGTSANWSERVKVTSTATTYNFLESELYKEKSFFNGWKVRIYTVSSNGNASTNYIEKSIDTSDYGTWTVPQITNLKVTVDSSGNGMRFSWNFERGNFYGTPKYKISYGWKKGSTTTSILTNEETFNTYFDRQFDRTKEQFPEASEFASSIVLKVQSVCDETNTSSSWVNWINTNLITTGYKTWIPSIINGLTAKANKDGSGLTFNWEKQNPSLCYGDVKYKINYKWNNVSKVTNAETQNNYYTRDFVRTSGNEQYPEKADLNSSTSKFNFTVQAVNIQSGKSQSTLTTVTTSDVSDYLTYKPSLKPISINGASRQVFLTLEPTVAHYGEIKYRVRIKRNALTWTTPQNTNQTVNADSSFCIVNDDTSTIYTSETSYKKTLASGETEKLYSSFTQTLPLIGQNYTYNSQSLPSPQSTTYTYEVMLKNVTSGYNSSVQTISYTINPTMARDVANSIITENKIATGAITNEKIGTGAITEVKISNNAITNTKISDNAISTSKLQANAITSNKISASAITAEKIATNAVTTAKLSANCVNASKIASSTITADKMAVTDLYAISSKFGKISNNSIAKDEFNYWDLETGDFRIGNSANENSDDAQYFKMSSNSISLKIANFIVKAITSIIKGIFKITQPNSTSSFLVANPYTSAKNPDDNTSESIPAKTVKVNGTVEADIIQNPWQTIDLSSNTYNQDMYYPVVAKSSNGIIELECLLNEIRSTITWSTHNQKLIVAYMHLYDIGNNWGIFIKKPLMLENQFRWCTKAPIYYTQMLRNSTFVFFLRGGASYKIRNSLGLTFSIKTSAYTVNEQTVAPTTDPTISGQDGNGVVSQFYDIINDYNWQDKLNKGISTTGTITSTGKITATGGIDSKSTLRVLNGTTEKFKVDTTGNVTNTGKLYVNNTTVLNATTNGAVQIGSTTGTYLDLDNHRVQAKNNGAVSQLNINTHGGKVLLGNSNSDLELRTNTTNSGTLTSAGLITANNGLQVKSGKSLKVGSDSVPRVVSWSGSTLTIDW